MNDVETQQRFVFLRSEGRTFAHIAEDLKISKPTLISWSRKFQYEIQNLRAIYSEVLLEKWLSSRDIRINAIGEQLRKAEAELAKRNLGDLSTTQLLHLVEKFRRQIKQEIGTMEFTLPASQIPNNEREEQVQDWKP
jgi:hypothetical protein